MQKLLLVLTVFLPVIVMAQWSDNFNDGNFASNPTWLGEELKFTVNAGQELQLNAPAVSDEANLYTPSAVANSATWECKVRMDFNPSSTNFCNVYLMASDSTFKGSLNGYFVQLGNTQDEISLYRQDGSTKVKIIDGVDGILNTTTVATSVKITRDAAGNWELMYDLSATGNYTTLGTATDNTYGQSAWAGVYCKYTSTRSDKFFFDDFVVTGQAFIDNIPPVIDSIRAISSDELAVYFNEQLNAATAQNSTNYTVNGGIGAPQSAALAVGNKAVTLQFSASFTAGQVYQLTVNGVADTTGNIMANYTGNFTYGVAPPPATAAVIINELMPDPSPVVALPDAEYIELYNTTNQPINLAGWKLTDGSSTATLPAITIAANGYAVFCANADTASFVGIATVKGLSSWPSLNNSGDNVSLLFTDGSVIDNVQYDLSWYKDGTKDDGGFSLERINPTTPCSGAANWKASNSLDGGTPGQQNAVFDNTPDTQAPSVVAVAVVSLTQLQVEFDEAVNAQSLVASLFGLNNGVNTVGVAYGASETEVVLNLNAALDSAVIYTLTVSGVKDCLGNASATSTHTFGIGSKPALFDVLITEIYAIPAGTNTILPEYEFVEIYNRSSKIISLDGLTFNDPTTTTLLPNVALLPGEYRILCSTTAASLYSPFGASIGLSGFPSLNNTGDRLWIGDTLGFVIHQVDYTDKWYQDDTKKSGGWSLELIDPSNPCEGSNNWIASEATQGATPGQVNSVNGSNPDNQNPMALRADALDANHVQITCNEKLILEGTAVNATFDGGITSLSYAVDATQKRFVVEIAPSMQSNTVYTVLVSGIKDCVNNTSEAKTFTIGLPESVDAMDIVINEILFDPRESGADFVELFNASDKFLDIKNWTVSNFDTEIDGIKNAKVIFEETMVLAPKEYLVLTIDTANISVEYPLAVKENYFQMASLPTFSNDEGSVVIADSTQSIIDRFEYNADMHFVLISNPEGVSLERLDPTRVTQDATNWHSAASNVGYATPGYLNSQISIAGETEDVVVLEPQIFSPDLDGYNDNLNISFLLDKPGYVGNITVYTDKGILIKRLVQNELLTQKGTYSWDGSTERGEKASIGIYVVYMEIFGLDGAVRNFKKTCVLAQQL